MKLKPQKPLFRNAEKISNVVRRDVLKMVHRANASHVGSCFSIVDTLAVLYGEVMKIDINNPSASNRDRFILSKGHAAAALYATLANVGIIHKSDLDFYGEDMSPYMTHASHKIPGVEFSSGSLGHGLPFGVGKALVGKRTGQAWKVFVLLSDGELDEGSNWEAFMFASHHKIDNLIAIIDYNKLQSLTTISETIGIEPIVSKIEAFGWSVKETDGHDHNALRECLESTPWHTGKPSLLLTHTIKGKGVSFMENKVEWHYRSPNDKLLEIALNEIGGVDA